MTVLKNGFSILLFLTFTGVVSHAQDVQVSAKDSLTFNRGKEYVLGDFTVLGLQRFSEEAVKVHSGLIKGAKIRLPGDKLTSAIKRLYETDQFSKVDVYLVKLDDKTAYLEFDVAEFPKLGEIKFPNMSKSKNKRLKEEAKVRSGDMVTSNFLITLENFFKKKYRDEGYLKTKVDVKVKKGTKPNMVNLLVYIDKGKRIKIRKIRIAGNEKLSDGKLHKAMKKTKQKFFGRFWKPSKYIEEEYKNDLQNVINVYSERGYRDAIITDKKLTWNKDNTIDLHLNIDEGDKYYFGNIDFVGNAVYSDEQLKNFLKLEKGDVYNSKVLKERVTGDGTPDSEDLQSLYLNTGYLFARVTPVETRVLNDSIDVEIRIYEDEPATIRDVTVVGNDRTNDYVIYRELYTKPGNLFSKEDIIRSIREISQLGFFDPEKIVPDVKPNQIEKTVDIEYAVAEKGASQIELQGGYGGRSFIGTLGLSFNNFSIKNIFNKEAYTHGLVPMGDGQSLSLRLQKSRFYSTYSFSFTEPWLDGKKPKSLSLSVYNSRQFGYTSSYEVNKDQSLNVWGASIGLGQRLKWPDNYFQLSQLINYQRYELDNYNVIRSLNFSNGVANNLSYSITLARNSSGPNPIFPTGGSEVSLTFKATPPFSLLNGKDYSKLDGREKYKWLEYYKTTFKANWYTPLVEKSVLRTNAEFGLLGFYNNDIGYSPFERYIVGGDGLARYRYDGSETIGLRGYDNGALSGTGGGTIYNKFSLEARYPITLKPAASIYVMGFLEAGNSYDEFDSFNPFLLKRSAGAGVRIFMPQFGLLGIDLAYGFDPIIKGGEKSGFQTHFILGQQF